MLGRSLHHSLAIWACFSVLPLALWATDYQGSFERRFQVLGPAQLELDTASGDTTVHSGPSGTVTVIGKIHVNNRWLTGDQQARVRELESNPPLRQEGNTIHVAHTNLHNISVDYVITVPADTGIQSHSGSGDLNIQDLTGELNLESGSGDLWLENIRGRITTRSGSGDVHARGISNAFSAEAASGDVWLEERGQGDVDIRTTSGNIEVRGLEGRLGVEASSGDVGVQGRPAANWRVKAGSGNIHLSIPRDAAFQLDANTDSGELEINHAVTTTVEGSLDRLGHSLEGAVGSGGPRVSVHTGSGDIDVD
ncbi:MAG: DUF4097 family beta strand repeat protein [Acidobacteria bacterium]|nr:DUF4097 family beta strand repeat protein [Acidobacteriota bacterium]